MGTAVVYASQSRSLAALEQLVQGIRPRVLLDFVFVSIELHETQIEEVAAESLPPDWDNKLSVDFTRSIGDRWVIENRSLALRVPSKVMPGEFNYLINPSHADFAKARKSKPQPFVYDTRLA